MTLGELAEKLRVLIEDNKIPKESEVFRTDVEMNLADGQLAGVETIRKYSQLVVMLKFQEYY